MTANGWLQFAFYCAVLLVVMRPLGIYMTGVFEGKYRFLHPLERAIYRISGIREQEEMTWRGYTVALLLFSLASMLLTYGFERLQYFLPWNPQHFPAVPPTLAFNTARTRVGEMLSEVSESVMGAAVVRAYGLDEHTDRNHKGDFPGLIHRYQFSDADSERLGDLDQRPPLPKNETGDGSCRRTGEAE